MDIKNLNPKNYKSLFRYEGKITALHSEFFVRGSHGECDPLVVNSNDVWNTFLNKKTERFCLNKGSKLFSSKDKYKDYANSFREYIEYVNTGLNKRYGKVVKDIKKEEFKLLLEKIFEFWKYYYGYTEWFFTDLAYKKSKETKDKILINNLKDFEKLKFEGRDTLNKLTHKPGIIHNILLFVSGKFLYEKDDADYLYWDELLSLFKDGKIGEDLIKRRKRCYAVVRFGSEVIKLDEKQCCAVADSFTKLEDVDAVKGVIANKGKVRGDVFVIPMMTDVNKISEITKKMNKGDILVAQSTTPELVPLCKKAKAIVADQGGMLSHAAIISRELNIPGIVGTNNATKLLKDGDRVEVDAYKGIVKIIKRNK